jgi:hypothetical protein
MNDADLDRFRALVAEHLGLHGEPVRNDTLARLIDERSRRLPADRHGPRRRRRAAGDPQGRRAHRSASRIDVGGARHAQSRRGQRCR